MKNGVLAFSLFLSAGVIGLAGFAGCSSSDDAPPVEDTDAGAETAVDTGTKIDTGTTDTGTTPTGCAEDLPSDFMCNAPAAKAGSTACTDKMLTELLNCFGSGDATKCKAAQAAYKDCDKCVEGTWVQIVGMLGFVDQGSCMQAIDPTSQCGKVTTCDNECVDAVCSTCSTDDMSGASGKAGSTEYDDCTRAARFAGSMSKPKGRCYDLATKPAKDCAKDPKFAPCVITSIDSVKNFYRGACRDNANWSKSTEPDGTETTTDAGTDSGPSDTGAATDSGSDSGSADSGSTDSGSTDSGSAADSETDSGSIIPDIGLGG